MEEEQGAASNELAQKVVELGTEGVGTAAWMHARWHGAAGPLIVLCTDTEEQRQTVYELTGVLVAPLDFEAAHTVGQSATQSTKWMQQKTRRTLNFNPLLEALKAGDGQLGGTDSWEELMNVFIYVCKLALRVRVCLRCPSGKFSLSEIFCRRSRSSSTSSSRYR